MATQANKEYFKVMDRNPCLCGHIECSTCEHWETLACINYAGVIVETMLVAGDMDLREALDFINNSV